MIIWINGAYGVGKTTVAQKIKEKLADNEIEILDSDFYYDEMINENRFLAFGGTLPQNNLNFIKRFKNVLAEKLENNDKRLIIVMAITQPECKKEIYDDIIISNENILHIILTASKGTLESRIQSDENRYKGTALEWLDHNLSFMERNFDDALRISTDNKSVRDIVDEIIEYICP